jgi:glucan 1,3-beta-glucosidase
LFGEWSVAYDILPSSQLNIVMDGIAKHGMAPMFDRTITPSQMNFMKRYAEAQMVVYESVEDDGTSSSIGWFYWNIKMEGGAFAEWDFLRGIKEGWIPELPGPTQNSEQAYGTCYDIIFKTFNDADITSNELPDPNHLPRGDWAGDDIDDDVVLTDGASLLKNDGIHHMQRYGPDEEPTVHVALRWILVCLGAALLVFVVRRRLHRVSSAKTTAGYSTIRNVE